MHGTKLRSLKQISMNFCMTIFLIREHCADPRILRVYFIAQCVTIRSETRAECKNANDPSPFGGSARHSISADGASGFRSAAMTASGERKKNVRAFVSRLPVGNPGERPKP